MLFEPKKVTSENFRNIFSGCFIGFLMPKLIVTEKAVEAEDPDADKEAQNPFVYNVVQHREKLRE